MRVKKIIYDHKENNIIENDHKIINYIRDKKINKERELKIYTWGIKKNIPVDCEIIFDCSLYYSQCDKEDIRLYTGLDEKIQNSIINHSKFNSIIEMIITEIETNNYKKISFVCNYGKYKSVGWAELLKKLYYNNSIIKHNNLKV